MRMNLLRSEQCPPPHLSSPYGLSLSVFLVCIYTREEFDVYFSLLSEDVVCVYIHARSLTCISVSCLRTLCVYMYTREEFDVYFSFLSEDVVCVF